MIKPKIMDKEEFIETLKNIISNSIEEFNELGPQAMLAINPVTHYITMDAGDDIQYDIADADETIEDGAAAQEPEEEDSTDYQASQNPDFYSLRSFIKRDSKGRMVPDEKEIEKVIAVYYPD